MKTETEGKLEKYELIIWWIKVAYEVWSIDWYTWLLITKHIKVDIYLKRSISVFAQGNSTFRTQWSWYSWLPWNTRSISKLESISKRQVTLKINFWQFCPLFDSDVFWSRSISPKLSKTFTTNLKYLFNIKIWIHFKGQITKKLFS